MNGGASTTPSPPREGSRSMDGETVFHILEPIKIEGQFVKYQCNCVSSHSGRTEVLFNQVDETGNSTIISPSAASNNDAGGALKHSVAIPLTKKVVVPVATKVDGVNVSSKRRQMPATLWPASRRSAEAKFRTAAVVDDEAPAETSALNFDCLLSLGASPTKLLTAEFLDDARL
uniref:Uncharacterized protein n=1 Tax=Romanomermis culicivorax TaxID=13658 RepID=A0A915JS58_ROMCU